MYKEHSANNIGGIHRPGGPDRPPGHQNKTKRMKRKFIITELAALCLALAALTGCNKKETSPVTGPVISFNAEDAFTKAVVTGVTDIQNDPAGIRVWDWHTSLAYPNGTHTFDAAGTQVTYSDGAWTYSPLRYWLNGTYDFFAVYPSTLSVTRDANGFNLGYSIDTQSDVLVASYNGINGANPPESVLLNFEHMLCQLEFAAKSKATDMQAILYGIDIKGAADAATYSTASSSWTGLRSTKEIAYTVKGSDNLNGVDYTTLETGILMIPQNISNIEIVVRYYGADDDNTLSPQEVTYSLPTSTFSAWEKGKKYKYLLSVEENGQISFAAPVITDWVSASGGSFIIDTPTNN